MSDESKAPKCNRINLYAQTENQTTTVIQGYEGIPQNLVVNLICWIIFIILFAVLRKKAWDYGRIALVSRNQERWTALFYGDKVENMETFGSNESVDSNIRIKDKERKKSMDTRFTDEDTGLCMWIPSFLKITDADIQRKSGNDAIQYLQFLRYLIAYMCFVGFFCVVVILPLNLHGNMKSTGQQAFGTSTMSNIEGSSPTLWVHTVFSVCFILVAVALMRHFSINLGLGTDDEASRTLMITGIPKKCPESLVSRHFKEAYPEAPLITIHFAYNIRKLTYLDRKTQLATDALRFSETLLRKSGQRPLMVPKTCGLMCRCCAPCGVHKVDAIEYYESEADQYRRLFEEEKVNALNSKLEIAFVTFASVEGAKRVLEDFTSPCFRSVSPKVSSVSGSLESNFWDVIYAPSPNDINWENLSLSPVKWWGKAILVNGAVFVLLFFLTTPAVAINIMNKLYVHVQSSFLVQFLSSLFFWLFSALLPFLVYYSDQIIGHWTKTSEHLAVMFKSYVYLILMVLILPSLGLTSISAMLTWIFPPESAPEVLLGQNSTHHGIFDRTLFQWACVFMPDNGAFFVNYVITSALIGTALELIRFPELLLYVLRLTLSRSHAERSAVRKAVLYEFQFGLSYAWLLCVFAVISTYSVLCPMITPFGILYLVIKYVVDRYNLYFAYSPSRIDKRIHGLAISCMLMGVLLLQVNVVVFLAIRLEVTHPLNVTALVCLFIVLILFVARIGLGWFKDMGPIKYKQNDDDDLNLTLRSSESNSHTSAPVFVPEVLSEWRPRDHQGDIVHKGVVNQAVIIEEEDGGASQ